MNPLKRQQLGEELLQRAAALRLLGQALAQEVSDSAGRIAQTEDDVARVRDAIANSGVSTTAADAHERAERARRYAQHERHEQQRWSRQAEAD